MTVEVFSDIMCPFCFLGKRRFAAALEHFAQSQDVAVTWRSFQLNPTLRSDATMSVNEYLAREKGIDPAQAALMHDRLVRLGENAGIEYNFDRAVVANTFDAHRMIHLAAIRLLCFQVSAEIGDVVAAPPEVLVAGRSFLSIPALLVDGRDGGQDRQALNGEGNVRQIGYGAVAVLKVEGV